LNACVPRGCESLTVWVSSVCSGPYVEIDMRSGEMDGYDAVFLSPHKFVGGPGTPGILLMNRALYRLAGKPPSTCGGGTVAYVNGFREAVSRH
jgi:selenocysteine lyase/cysteine desulfurase